MSDPFEYPGDDVMGKALGEALKQARLEAGLSIEEAEERLRMEMEGLDYKRMARAMGRAIKEARETRHLSRKELSSKAGLPLGRLIALERGSTENFFATEFFRISYAMKMRPHELAECYEEIDKNSVAGKVSTSLSRQPKEASDDSNDKPSTTQSRCRPHHRRRTNRTR
jgi:transcriptional regulator with XRE-family HTH domain